MFYTGNFIKQKETNFFHRHLMREFSSLGDLLCSFYMGEMEEGKGQATESISDCDTEHSIISDSGLRQFGDTCWPTSTLTSLLPSVLGRKRMGFPPLPPQMLRVGDKRGACLESCGQGPQAAEAGLGTHLYLGSKITSGATP